MKTTTKAREVLALRLDVDAMAALDRYVEALNRNHPGLGVTRSGAARELLVRALAGAPKK